MDQTNPTVAVIGGSGLYSLLDKADDILPETPYGQVSDVITTGVLSGRHVAFLPRHGKRHQHPPHRVNYRANVWALRELGVRHIIGAGAVGSLDPAIEPGTLVVPDQLVDRTWGREQTYFDGPGVAHAPFADPYCPVGRSIAVQVAEAGRWTTVDGGTQVVINGPRFSTRAESVWHAAQGWSIVGMTAAPEATLARELGICYTPICLVTDYDAGVAGDSGVTQEEVIAAFGANVERLHSLLADLVAQLPSTARCGCPDLRPDPL